MRAGDMPPMGNASDDVLLKVQCLCPPKCSVYLHHKNTKPYNPKYSDYDFIVGCDKPTRQVINFFNKELGLYHDALIMPIPLLREFQYIMGLDNCTMQHIYGAPVNFNRKHQVMIDFRIWDDCVEHLFNKDLSTLTGRELHHARWHDKIPQRMRGHDPNIKQSIRAYMQRYGTGWYALINTYISLGNSIVSDYLRSKYNGYGHLELQYIPYAISRLHWYTKLTLFCKKYNLPYASMLSGDTHHNNFIMRKLKKLVIA